MAATTGRFPWHIAAEQRIDGKLTSGARREIFQAITLFPVKQGSEAEKTTA
jgi:hypothetical protein